MRSGNSDTPGGKSNQALAGQLQAAIRRHTGVSRVPYARVTNSSIVPPGRVRPPKLATGRGRLEPWPEELRPLGYVVGGNTVALTDSTGRYRPVPEGIKREAARQVLRGAVRLVRQGVPVRAAIYREAGAELHVAVWACSLLSSVSPYRSLPDLEERASQKEVLEYLLKAVGRRPARGGWRVSHGGAR